MPAVSSRSSHEASFAALLTPASSRRSELPARREGLRRAGISHAGRSVHIATPRARAALVVLALAFAGAATAALPSPHPAVPEVVAGYALAPLAPVPAATAITFGPEGDLYVTTLTGSVLRYPLTWTPAGPVAAAAPEVHASGFGQPLGLVFVDGTLFVADSESGIESGRLDGRVSAVVDGGIVPVVSGLPNGRHNTNNLREGPDGRLYIANGNPNDNGRDGGEADVLPLSGAVLSVDPAVVLASPAVLRWRAEGSPIAPGDIATHPVNADFAAKVAVFASGFRNIYDVAFGPTGIAYTATNGADDPDSQDLLYRLTPGADHGFPFCYNVGPAGGVGADVSVVPNPVFGDAERCAGAPPATALLGWHVCATGLDVGFGDNVFIGECGPFYESVALRSAEDPARATHNTGHKVVRVALDEDGHALGVQDFISGLHLPVDVHFGPDGAMYVADVDAVYRVVKLV